MYTYTHTHIYTRINTLHSQTYTNMYLTKFNSFQFLIIISTLFYNNLNFKQKLAITNCHSFSDVKLQLIILFQ